MRTHHASEQDDRHTDDSDMEEVWSFEYQPHQGWVFQRPDGRFLARTIDSEGAVSETVTDDYAEAQKLADIDDLHVQSYYAISDILSTPDDGNELAHLKAILKTLRACAKHLANAPDAKSQRLAAAAQEALAGRPA